MKKIRFVPLIIYLLLLSLVFSFVLDIFRVPGYTIPYSGIVSMIESGNVKSFVVEDQTITLELREPLNDKTKVVSYLADPNGFRSQMWNTLQTQLADGTLKDLTLSRKKNLSPWIWGCP